MITNSSDSNSLHKVSRTKWFAIVLLLLLVNSTTAISTAFAESKAHGEKKAEKPAADSESKKPVKKSKLEPVVGKAKGNNHAFEKSLDTNKPLQIVLVLDSSRSMQRTDPKNLRNQAAKLLFRFLGKGDSIAIQRFDRDVAPVSDFQPVGEETLPLLDAAVDSIPLEGNFTNLEQPIRHSFETLVAMGDKTKQPVVVLLSDGKMDPAPSQGTASALNRKVLDVELKNYREKNIPLYTLALGEEADSKLLEKFALAARGESWAAADVSTIHERFTELFLELKQPVMTPLIEGGFLIDSSVKEATFYVSHEVEKATITLIDPNEEVISADSTHGDVRWFHGDAFEIITVIKPEPGNWRVGGIEHPEGFATLLSDISLQVQWPEAKFRVGDNVAAYARLLDKGKPVTASGIQEHLALSYSVTKAGGAHSEAHSEEGELSDLGEEGDQKKGDFVFSRNIRVNDTGDFVLRILATTPTFRREQQRRFSAAEGTIRLEQIVPEPDAHHEAEASETRANSRYFRVVFSEEAKHTETPELELVLKRPNGKEKTYSFEKKEPHDTFVSEVPEGLEAGSYSVRARMTISGGSKGATLLSSNEVQFTISEEEASAILEARELLTARTGAIFSAVTLLWAVALWFFFLRGFGGKAQRPSGPSNMTDRTEELKAQLEMLKPRLTSARRAPTDHERTLFALAAGVYPTLDSQAQTPGAGEQEKPAESAEATA